MSIPLPWNYFRSMATSFSIEDFFTATVASLMQGVPEARRAFLEWIDEHVGEGLLDFDWHICAQKTYKTRTCGDAVLDMVLTSGRTELWFEHKVGAKEGIRKTSDGAIVSQLVKYQQARELHEAETGTSRVLLLYVTAQPEKVDKNTIGLLHEPGGRGFVFVGEEGSLQWRDLHPRMRDALHARQNGGCRDSATTLFEEFMGWWDTVPTMRSGPASTSLYPDDRSDLKHLWPKASAWLERVLPGRYGDYGGWGIEGRPDGHAVDYLEVSPRKPEKIDGWNVEVSGVDVLRVSLRTPTRNLPKEVGPFSFNQDGRWPGLLTYEKTPNGVMTRVHIRLSDWDDRLDDEGRQRCVLGAVQAAVHAFERHTGTSVTGPHD